MSNMTKSDYVGAIAEKAGVTKAEAEKIVNAIDEVTREQVAGGATVPIPGVGKVAAVDKPERTMRNPATGENFVKAAHKAPKVTIGKALKDAVNA
ncbi:HU family DNA-binding protein [Leisingera caerulea]|uniref:HU family DNA-binding protein n=1 Tax=Leisingera caerulea TaxID=506591 RepID=UPI0003FE6E4C|nr:HU family DNA-binding protein [Leisingera caerulea]